MVTDYVNMEHTRDPNESFQLSTSTINSPGDFGVEPFEICKGWLSLFNGVNGGSLDTPSPICCCFCSGGMSKVGVKGGRIAVRLDATDSPPVDDTDGALRLLGEFWPSVLSLGSGLDSGFLSFKLRDGMFSLGIQYRIKNRGHGFLVSDSFVWWIQYQYWIATLFFIKAQNDCRNLKTRY